MTISCPYCGAALKLKFCVVCGRQSKLNKMGSIRGTSRNTDATTRLAESVALDEFSPQKSLRFRTNFRPMMEATFSGIIAGILIFCAGKEALNLYNTGTIRRIIIPWIKTHSIDMPKPRPPKLASKNHPRKVQKKPRENQKESYKTRS